MLPETVEALDALGISSPFPIQAATIPVALAGSDVIGQAKTGTGKTLAFGIPMLQRVSGPGSDPDPDAAGPEAAAPAAPAKSGSRRRRGRSGSSPASALAAAHGSPQALVVVPTRELAVQVTNDLLAAGKVRAIRVHALYGGRAYEPQVAALRAGIDIAVGTPGRLLDLNRQGHLDLNRVRTLVLDEADEMLDLGFLPDVERIIAQLPAQRQTMLFSATMPGQVISLARQYMTKPTHIRAADPHDAGTTVRSITQFVYRAHSLDKVEMLSRILQADGRGLTMIFARTKRTVAKVAEELADRHFAAAAVHGDLGQGAREQALRAFRNGKVDVLVATDVAARGIDVEGVTHVINFQCPEDEKVYTHRIGRTGRAGATGTAITLVDWDEVPRWQLINKALALSLAEPPELYSTSPQLYADLGIPEGVKGVLPRQDRVRQGLDAEQIEDIGETGHRQAKAPARRGARDRDAAPAAARAERPARTPRQRNRTRGGVKLGAEGQGEALLLLEETESPAGSAAVSDEVVLDAAAESVPRRRSRTRKGAASGRGGGSVKLEPGSLAGPPAAGAVVTDAPTVPTPATSLDVESAHDAESGDQAPAAPARKRTRTRKAAAAAPAEETAIAETDSAAVGSDEEDLNAGPVANPGRTRLRPPRNRTRKGAPVSPAAAADTDEQAAS